MLKFVKSSFIVLAIGAAHSAMAAYTSADKVYRAGTCTAKFFETGTGVTVGADGKMSGVSTAVAPGKTDADVGAYFPNKKMGIATYGAIVKAGGAVVASPTAANPYHSTLSGITPAVAESLFTVVTNPNPCPR
jgi:hypothetical protein